MQKQTALKQCQKRKLRDEKQFHQGENKNHWNVRDILRTGQNIPGLIIFTATCSMAIRFFFVCVCVCVGGGGGGGQRHQISVLKFPRQEQYKYLLTTD